MPCLMPIRLKNWYNFAKDAGRSGVLKIFYLVFSLFVNELEIRIQSEKAIKFCEIATLILSVCTVDKSRVAISQNFVAFSEYMNFNGSGNML